MLGGSYIMTDDSSLFLQIILSTVCVCVAMFWECLSFLCVLLLRFSTHALIGGSYVQQESWINLILIKLIFNH